ncbi:SCO family protein [Parashewanella curva]|uniref:SCO family protein n=1 Tax=Parashewanella curva TaxID=2338552 RepID=A0A3L8PV64_9GAMM|nr:SCO family protein [Parashewanella curva]RLV59216.1 SCO family protein [Parashewanella curva]
MKKPIVIAIAMLIASLGAITAWQLQQPKAPLTLATSFEFPTPQPVIPFALTDQHGKAFTNQSLQGKWTLVFVGFTSCPDICPTTMGKLSAAYPKLKKHAPFQIMFLSVDPQRDTVTKLKDYMDFFNPEFVAVTGEHTQLVPLTRNLGMAYTINGEGEDYLVDHSASMTLISPQGQRIAIIKPKAEIGKIPHIKNKELVADVEALMEKWN